MTQAGLSVFRVAVLATIVTVSGVTGTAQSRVASAAACGWHEGFWISDLDGQVNALAMYDDGSGEALYAGGSFIAASGIIVNRIARWDGSAWSALPGSTLSGVNGTVSALAVFDDGNGEALYVGGSFSSAGGVTVNRVARWDGSAWSALSGPSGTGTDDTVSALAVYDDGGGEALYAGGKFSTAGGVTVSRIARWDGSAWSALSGPTATGVNSNVYSLAVYDDGGGADLYAGGAFTTAGGTTVNRIARWDGSSWSALSGPTATGVDGKVYSLVVYDDGGGADLYAGGELSHAGGIMVSRIARWDGTAWSALAGPSGTGVNSTVFALAVHDDGSGTALYAGGYFLQAGGVSANGIARWDGSAWSAVAGPGEDDLPFNPMALAEYNDGGGADLYVGGDSFNFLSRWDGSAWSALDQTSGAGTSDTVKDLAVYDRGGGAALYAGGRFHLAGGLAVNHVAGWDGSAWSALTGPDGTGTDKDVDTLGVFDDGSGEGLYAGGEVEIAGGVTVSSIGRWDGTGWSALAGSSGTGTSYIVEAMAVYDDGNGPALYVAGDFSTAGGLTANNIARWDGNDWSVLDGPSGTGTSSSIHTLAVYDDGTGSALYAGGAFVSAGGVTVNRIARWNGSAWSAVDGPAGTGMDDQVIALAVYDDGTGSALYAGGRFTTAGGVPVSYIARWDGSSWSALTAPGGTGVDGYVWSLAVYDDGNGPGLYAGGYFIQAGGVTTYRIARWNGSNWSTLSGPAGIGADSTVFTLQVFDDGSNGPALYAGGSFSSAGGLAAAHIGMFSCDTAAPQNPTAKSTSHSIGSWSNSNVIGVEWDGARDIGRSGLNGYSLLFDQQPATLPDDDIDIYHTGDPHSTSSAVLADSAGHTFHLRTCDHAGNCSQALHLGPYPIDTTAPGSVSAITSSSHPIGVPTADSTIDLSWAAAADGLSGVAGYAYRLDSALGWSCDQVVDTTATAITSGELADRSWYLHVCAVDAAGNWGPVVSAGPFIVRTQPDPIFDDGFESGDTSGWSYAAAGP